MMKRAVFSISLAFTFAFALAQDAAKESKSTPVELNRSSKYDIIDNKPIIIKGEAVIVKEEKVKKGEQPAKNQKPVKAVIKPAPAMGTKDNNK